MGDIVESDVIEAACRMEFDGSDDIMNVYQFQVATPVIGDDQDVLDDIMTWLEIIYGIINASIVALQLYRDIRFRNVTQTLVYGAYPWPTLTAGISANDAVAPGVCLLANFATGVPRVSPRKYWGVLNENVVDADGVWASSVVGSGTSMVAALLGGYVGSAAAYIYGYLSPKTMSFVMPNAGVVTNIPAYQRRRKQGRGS